MSITPFSGAPILNAAVHPMCAWHVPVAAGVWTVVLNQSPEDLVNVGVKLNIDSSFGRWIC